ncbi:MAG TPA: ATP-dependent DNA helicase RecG [Pirellulales bacterium]
MSPPPVRHPLFTPLSSVRGITPAKVAALANLDIRTVRDLVFNFPRGWEDLTALSTIDTLEEGVVAVLRLRVVEFEARSTGVGRSKLGVLFRQDAGDCRGLWFNQPFMAGKFLRGQEVIVEGRPKLNGRIWEFHHPRVRWLDEEGAEQEYRGRVAPVYGLTEGLTQRAIRDAMTVALDTFADTVEEAFPAEFLGRKDLWPLAKALRQIHFPDDVESQAHARRRFVYQELLALQTGLALRRQGRQSPTAPALPTNARIEARIRRLFGFEFTPGQAAAVAEIAADMARTTPMNRLLQGDVGSGKTVAAVYAMLLAASNRHQAVLMAPTEVLARQHARTLDKLLAGSRVRRALLIGGASSAARADTLSRLAAGEIDLVVGTQALLEDNVRFARLGVVVIDEQHKFGVRQRSKLKTGPITPHYLVMTATPIPRTVAMTLYGDLDVSILRDAPPGRKPIYTYWATEDQRAAWWEFVRRKLAEGRQAYVVAPHVEDNEEQETQGVESIHRALATGPFADYRVGLVHGRMSSAQKDAALEDFRSGRTQVLAATSVVEVGVDVPNAVIMTIEGGQHFGLAALHQLRGRIVRGAHSGFCCVFADATTEDGKKRIEAFASTHDGFELAEVDFALRGPGEFFNGRQHGLPPLYLADLSADRELLLEARRDAAEIVAADPHLAAAEWSRFRSLVMKRYGAGIDLADVG